MSMTREEARIEIQSLKDTFEELEPGGTRTQFALEIALTALRPIRREQVEKAWKGEWIKRHKHRGGFRRVKGIDDMGEQHEVTIDERCEYDDLYCSKCGKQSPDNFLNFCGYCGAPMTDEAVDMVMERMEKMKYIGIPNEFEDIFRGVELSGVELSEGEIRTLNWIVGWDRQTVENLRSVIQKAQAIALSTLTPPNEPLTQADLDSMDYDTRKMLDKQASDKGGHLMKCRDCEKLEWGYDEGERVWWCAKRGHCPDLDVERNCSEFSLKKPDIFTALSTLQAENEKLRAELCRELDAAKEAVQDVKDTL